MSASIIVFLLGKPRVRMKFPLLIMSVGPPMYSDPVMEYI